MFLDSEGNGTFSQDLDGPWAVNIIPVFLTQAGKTLVITTTFEFISAQSSHSMKGLLIGVFYVMRGLFNFFGAISAVPFSSNAIWAVNDI